jgi:hypothetical protein
VRGNRPQEGAPCASHGDPDLRGVFASGHQLAIPCAEPDVRLPAERLDRGGELFQAQGPVPAAVRWRPRRPGTFHQGTTRRGLPGCGQAAVLTTCPTRLCRRRQPQILQTLAGGIEARQGAPCGPQSRRDRAWDAPESLARLDDGLEAPGVHLLVPCVFQTLEAFGVCGHRLDLFLQDPVLRGGGTDSFPAPTQVGGAPMGPPGRAASVPQHEGVETQRGRVPIPEGVCTRPAEGAQGVLVDGGARDGGAISGAHEPGQLPGVTPGGCDPSARLFGQQGRGDAPADLAVVRQGAREPVAARAGFVDADTRRPL